MKNILPTNVADGTLSLVKKLSRYKFIIFALLVVGVYSYIILTISTLSTAQPSAEQISEQSSPIKSAKIDPKIVLRLQQLQDNSVSVQALFNEARDNPFQEN